jgi:hypothetical protein
MNKFKVILIAILSFTLTACSGVWSCGAQTGPAGTTGGCKVQGVWYQQAMNFLRPSINMLAESMGFTYQDWSSSDFSDFSLGVNSSSVSIKNNSVKVLVYQGASLLGSKNFSVYRQSNDYFFSNPSAVKDWGYNFVDIADYTDVEFDLVKSSSGTITVGAKENNVTKASASVYHRRQGYCDNGICYEEP